MTKLGPFTLYPDRPCKVEMTDNLNLRLTDGDRFIFLNLSDEEVLQFAAKMNNYNSFRRRRDDT